ncbi:hypothetical protein AHAS_Ahas15G0187000 [Arachis hypogaea]
MFSQVFRYGILPDGYTFSSLFQACAKVKALQEGKQLHCLAMKIEVSENTYMCPTLINMYTVCNEVDTARTVFDKIDEPCVVAYSAIITRYARNSRPNETLALFRELCGSMDDAILVFRQMRRRDTQTWSVMIVAYAMHGHGSRAVSMLEEMKKEKVQPDEITFVAVLSACSHNGLVEEGYISILDDSHGGDYVVLSNLCARYGKWEDVNFLRKNMVDKGAVNIPGCSSIEVNNIVHVFFSGDGVHSTSTALHHALDKLLKELKLAGQIILRDVQQFHHFKDGECSCGDYWAFGVKIDNVADVGEEEGGDIFGVQFRRKSRAEWMGMRPAMEA